MLKKALYLFLLVGLFMAVGCTKDHVVEPKGFLEKNGGVSSDTNLPDDDVITDDEDDEGDGERDRKSDT